MKQHNYDRVQKKVFYTGGGNDFDVELKESMDKGLKEFSIAKERLIKKVPVQYNLFFNKSDKENTFFNSFDVAFEKDGIAHKKNFKVDNVFRPEVKEKHPGLSMTFTLGEAYRYMEGASVFKLYQNKDGEIYPAWRIMDLNQRDENGRYKEEVFGPEYGFDFAAKLAAQPLKELQSPKETADLHSTLMKGNVATVTYMTAEGEYKRKMVVDAKYKDLKYVDNPLELTNSQKIDKPGSISKQNSPVKDEGTGESEEDSPKSSKKYTRKKGNTKNQGADATTKNTRRKKGQVPG